MKILIWSQYFWPETFLINELAAGLSSAGHEVTVLTGKPNYPEGRLFPGYRAAGIDREDFGGAMVVRIPLLPRGKGSAARLAANYLSFILSGYLFAPWALRGREFDAVLVYAPSPLLQALPAIFIAHLKRAPLVVWVQDLWPEALSATGHVRNAFALRVVKALVRHIYRHADSILIQSEAFREPVMHLVGGADKLRFYPNSADRPRPATSASEAAMHLAAEMREHFSVLFAGNVGRAQSMETIVAAAECLRAVPSVRFYIVGSGSRSEWLATEIGRRNLRNIVLAGRHPTADMPALMAAASALLVTLRKDPIGAYTIPSKLQAYLAAGRPIVASMNGEGARIVAEAGAGPTCPAEDGAALAEAVRGLFLMPPTERNLLGERGRRYCEAHFDAGRLLHELINHLDACRWRKKGTTP